MSRFDFVYDPGLVETVATNLNLRKPNKDAVTHISAALEGSVRGQQLVADLATGVGKTYVAGGLLDYLHGIGVRNIVIITPGSTIQRKTISNLTPGHPKYLRGLQSRPVVITIDDFAKGNVAQALENPDLFKVFVFTVQSLLRPNTKENRRAHRDHETVGQSLSDYLAACDDLVVIADEHHVYAGNATKFADAISSLDPEAVIGLTATPDPSTPASQIVYHYPLADAIADGYVKIPVLVARPDGVKDIRAQLTDGLALLDAKVAALSAYCEEVGEQFCQPVLFVVASFIDEANEIRDILAGPDMLGSDDQVLVITSDQPDTTLAKLETLEEPGSPIRAVVSVSMLKEGWDVKNIYVIAAVRALESQLLTEQVLGRGLRLPFGKRTRVGMLDTVEVLSHHAFSKLLGEAQVLLTQTLGQRAAQATATTETVAGVPDSTGSVEQIVEQSAVSGQASRITISLPGPAAADVQPTLFDADGDTDFGHEVGIIATVSDRLADGKATAETLANRLSPQPIKGLRLPLFIPSVHTRLERAPFSLTKINLIDVEALGREFADDCGATLTRKALEATRGVDGKVTVEVSDRSAEDPVLVKQIPLPFGSIEEDLRRRLVSTNAVAETTSEFNAATGIARAFLAGAEVGEETPWRPEHARRATNALVQWLGVQQSSAPPRQVVEVTQAKWPETPERVETDVPANRNQVTSSKQFVRGKAYKGWSKSIYPVAAFDSWSAEFRLAEVLEMSDDVIAWTRITSDVPLRLPYSLGAANRTYIPDFIVIDSGSVFWIVEGKAESEMSDPVVAAKRAAAEAWVDAVNAASSVRTRWAYALVSESTVKASRSWKHILAGAQRHS